MCRTLLQGLTRLIVMAALICPAPTQAEVTAEAVAAQIDLRIEQLQDEAQAARVVIHDPQSTRRAVGAARQRLQQVVFRTTRLGAIRSRLQRMPPDALDRLHTYFQQFVSSA